MSKSRFALASLAAIILVLAILFGSSAMTVLAAQSALPGDTLYPIKTRLEQTRLSLAGDAAGRAQMQLEFAERRLEEIEALIGEGQFTNVSAATLDFETHIRSALAELEAISQEDPARAADLMLQVTESLTRYAQTLGNMLANVPEPVKEEMQRAIESIHGVSGGQEPAGGLETPGAAQDDANANDNENANVNDSMNANENANGEENINANANEQPLQDDNGNADDPVIGNENETLNENSNTSPDPGGTVGNENSNTNDDRGVDNDNGVENHNGVDNDDGVDNANDSRDDNGNDNDDGGNDNGSGNDNDD